MRAKLPNDLQDYISAILGMKQPYRLEARKDGDRQQKEPKQNDGDDPSVLLLHSLLEADSLWNLGEVKQSNEIVKSCQSQLKDNNPASSKVMIGSFASGLQSLNAGALTDALGSFRTAAAAADDVPLLKAFFTERAVNIAFWMACSGSMLEAAKLLEDHIENTPFCGGVLSFAYHMSGDSIWAESIARTAIASGMDDPWTIHAVAHALTSQDSNEECADWLVLHRSKVEHCNTFMKGHMEFHLALSYIYLKDEAKLKNLIYGNLWGTMSEEMKSDYWNAAGLLNVLWKAEIRGVISNVLHDEQYSNCINQALEKIESAFKGDANASKSSVFSLCIFRFTSGSMREKWKKALILSEDNSDNTTSSSIKVLSSVAKAISILYHGGNNDSHQKVLDPLRISGTKQLMEPVAGKLSELGASPEQRETIHDFVQMILLHHDTQ